MNGSIDGIVLMNFTLFVFIQILYLLLVSPNIFLYLLATLSVLLICFINFNLAVVLYFIFLSAIAVFYSVRGNKDLFSPAPIFTAAWFFAIGISNLRLSIYEDPWSPYLWLNILLSILAFYAGIFIVDLMNKRTFVCQTKIISVIKFTWNNFKTKLVLSFMFIISALMLLCEFNYAGAFPLFAGLTGLYADTVRADMAVNSFVHRIALSMVNVFILSCYYMMIKKRAGILKNFLPLVFSVFSLAFIALTASRLFLANMIMPVLIGYNYLVRKINKKMLVILCISVFLLLVISVAVARNILPFDYLENVGFSQSNAWVAPGYLSISMNFGFLKKCLRGRGIDSLLATVGILFIHCGRFSDSGREDMKD